MTKKDRLFHQKTKKNDLILLIILLGYIVRRIGHWSDDFYKQLNQLCFRLFLPLPLSQKQFPDEAAGQKHMGRPSDTSARLLP